MSLINDALNRARSETAQREAEQRGEVTPGIEVPRQVANRGKWLLLAAVIMVTALVVFWVRQEQPPRTVSASAGRTESPAATAGSSTEVAPSTPGASPPAPGSSTANSTPSAASASAPPTTPGPALPGNDDEPQLAAGDSRSASAQAAITQEAPTQRVSAQEVVTQNVETPSPIPVPSPARPRAAAEAPAEPQEATTSPSGQPTVIWPTDADADADETWYYVGEAGLPGGGTIELGGIAWSASAPSAILNGSLLTVGDEILGLRIAGIARRTVTLAGQGRRIALQLGAND